MADVNDGMNPQVLHSNNSISQELQMEFFGATWRV